MVSVTIFLSFFAALFFLPGANLKRAAEAEVVLNCNANVIPRLSAGGECQALRAKAIVGRPCALTGAEAGICSRAGLAHGKAWPLVRVSSTRLSRTFPNVSGFAPW